MNKNIRNTFFNVRLPAVFLLGGACLLWGISFR